MNKRNGLILEMSGKGPTVIVTPIGGLEKLSTEEILLIRLGKVDIERKEARICFNGDKDKWRIQRKETAEQEYQEAYRSVRGSRGSLRLTIYNPGEPLIIYPNQGLSPAENLAQDMLLVGVGKVIQQYKVNIYLNAEKDRIAIERYSISSPEYQALADKRMRE